MEYGAVLLLVSAIVAAVTVVAIPDTVASKTKAAVCSIFSGKNCDPGKDKNPGGPPSPESSRPVRPPTTVPAGSEPISAEQAEYDKAKQEADQAEKDAKAAEGEFDGLEKELLDFLIDLIGITDAKNCITKGDLVACISAAADFVPWGKAFKLLKKLPKAFKLAKKFKNIWDKVDAARKRRQTAQSRLKKAIQACTSRKKNSFVPGTRVLLADGSRRPIEDIRIGDRVWATDPVTGRSGARPVIGLITGSGRKELVDITVDPDGLPGGPHVTVTATDRHPFWVADAAAWIDAEDLTYGDTLIAPGGRSASVVATRERIRVQRVHNLTVAGLHTYHVTAGGTDVLVHNQGPEDECGLSADDLADLEEDAALMARHSGRAKELGFETVEDMGDHLAKVMKPGSGAIKRNDLKNGREAWYDEGKGLIVIRNTLDPARSTVYRGTLDDLLKLR